MSTEHIEYTSDDIDLMLQRAQRFNLLADHTIFSKGRPADKEGWCELIEDICALNHAISEQLKAARVALDNYVTRSERANPASESSVPSTPQPRKPSSKAAEKATI